MSMNVKSGDNVVVISGKDAGKQGKVLTVNPKTNRVVVAGVNIISKHQKARKAQDKSEIVKTEGAIDVSNVMIVCPTCGKGGAVLDKKFVKETKKAAKKSADADAKKAQEKAKSSDAKEKAVEARETRKKSENQKATSVNKDTKIAGARKSSQRGV